MKRPKTCIFINKLYCAIYCKFKNKCEQGKKIRKEFNLCEK